VEGPLPWARRKARRVLANDPQTTAIRRAVGWASLAGAALGVVLAFVAAEPVDEAGSAGWRARATRPIARADQARHSPRGQTRASSPLPPTATAPAPERFEDTRPAPAPAPAPFGVTATPPSERPPLPEEPARADTPAALPSAASQKPVASGRSAATSAAPRWVVGDRGLARSSPAVAIAAGTEVMPPAKGRRRESPAAAAALAGSKVPGERGADADELVWLAEHAFQAGHPAEAVRLGEKALAAGGGARAQLTIAGAYFDMRDFDRARSAYEAVLAAEPGNQAARTGLEISRGALARSIARAP